MQKVHEKMGKVILISILVSVYFLLIPPYALEDLRCERLFSSFAHHFFHANIFHLAVNCLCIWSIYNSKRSFVTLPMAFAIATASYFFALRPTIGFSNILFASMGILSPSLKSRWWRSRNAIVFLCVTAMMAFVPSISAVTHMVSFALGVLYACVSRSTKKLLKDMRYATRQ